MKITIAHNASKEEIAQKLGLLTHAKEKKKTPADFTGALKGVFEDGLMYQKKVRKDWDGLPG